MRGMRRVLMRRVLMVMVGLGVVGCARAHPSPGTAARAAQAAARAGCAVILDERGGRDGPIYWICEEEQRSSALLDAALEAARERE